MTTVNQDQSLYGERVELFYEPPVTFLEIMELKPQCLFDYYNTLFSDFETRLLYKSYFYKLPIEQMGMMRKARMKIWTKIRS